MRILVLAPFVPDPPDHGGKIRSRVLLEALARLGEVTLAAPGEANAGTGERLRATLGVAFEPLPPVAGVPPSAAKRKLALWLRGRADVLERRWTPAARDAARALFARRHDLVALDGSHVLPLVPRAALGDAAPRLLHLHNIESAVLRRPPRRGPYDTLREWLSERIARAVESRLIARAEAAHARAARLCITVSALDRDRLLALCPRARVEVVENAIDLRARPFLPPPPSGPPLLLFVGSFGYPPNFEAMIELLRYHLPELRRAHPGVRIRLIGDDPDGNMSILAHMPNVEIAGRVADIVPHYREATAVYLPIRSGGGTRIKVLEAFAFGRPVLSTAVGVEGLDVEPGVHYLPFETPAEGVRALDRVLSGTGAAALALARAARARVEERWGHAAAVERMTALIAGAWSTRPVSG